MGDIDSMLRHIRFTRWLRIILSFGIYWQLIICFRQVMFNIIKSGVNATRQVRLINE